MTRGATLTVERKRGEVSAEDLARKKSGLVKVGILSGAGKHPSSDSATFAEIALYLEYGTEGPRGIQEYAPFRKWLSSRRSEYRDIIEKTLRKYLLGELSYKRVIQTLGRMGEDDLKDQFKTQMEPANKESTQIAKGEKTGVSGTMINDPLVDSGKLRQAISYGEV